MGNILVIGSANTDYVIETERMPKPGETLKGTCFTVQVGGKGLNQAVAAAKLGGEVTFVGSVGNDENGRMLYAAMERYGIKFHKIPSEEPTGIAMITVANGENTIVLYPGANHSVSSQGMEAQAALFERADWVLLQMEIPTETIETVCRLARSCGAKVILNPAPFTTLADEVYRQLDIVIPNEHEAAQLTGMPVWDIASAKEAAKQMIHLGIRQSVITLGEHGCVYTIGDEVFHHPANIVTAVDTTSAGDTFIGALAVKLSENAAFSDAIDYAVNAASVTVTRRGAAQSIPTKEELLRLYP